MVSESDIESVFKESVTVKNQYSVKKQSVLSLEDFKRALVLITIRSIANGHNSAVSKSTNSLKIKPT
jgi:hypothetical protein